MLELALSALDAELPPHCYVAMRVGDSQKIGRMSSDRVYTFDEKNVGGHKFAMLDVFQRIGGSTVRIKSKHGDQDVRLNTRAGKLHFRVSSGTKSSTKSQQQVEQDALSRKQKIYSKFEAAKAYIGKHNLEERLKNAMKEVIHEMPDDPVDFITNELRKSDFNHASDKPQPAMLQPKKVAPQPEKAATKSDAGDMELLKSKTRQALRGAAGDGGLSKENAPEDSLRDKTRQESKFPSFAEAVIPPKALTEEEVEDFTLQIEDFREDLSDEQIVRCKVAFSKFENIDEGTITKECLGDVLRKIGQKPTESALKSMMFELDVEGLGTITFPQFLSVVVDRIQEEEAVQELIPAFRVCDRNGDGFVSCSVIRRVMAGLGNDYTEAEVNDMIEKAGANADGEINYAGFANVMVLRM